MSTLHEGNQNQVSRFAFDKATHTYTYEGKKMTGVTSVIGILSKPALIGWASKTCALYIESEGLMAFGDGQEFSPEKFKEICDAGRTAHTKKKEEAGTHGTDTHTLVEEYINGLLKDNNGVPMLGYMDAQHAGIKKFTDWAEENVDHFLFSERVMYNQELFIAGTADFAYIGTDGKRYMGDFKTSSGIYGIDYWLQVAGYRLLAEAEGDEPYDGSTVARLGKDGSFEALNRYDYQTDKEAFLACLTIYRAQGTFKK